MNYFFHLYNTLDFSSVGSLLSCDKKLLTYATNEKYVNTAHSKDNVSVLFARDQDVTEEKKNIHYVLCDHPLSMFFLFHNYLIEHTDFYKSFDTEISDSAKIPKSTYISGKNVYIGDDVIIGENCVIEKAHIEKGTIIQSNTCIGVEGARLIKNADGQRFLAKHGGSVYIGSDCIIGSNSVIVRSVWDTPTTIGNNTFIGNLVNIAHNCYIGHRCTILPNTMLCGRAKLGNDVTISPGCCINNGVEIGNGSWVKMGTVVSRNVDAKTNVRFSDRDLLTGKQNDPKW